MCKYLSRHNNDTHSHIIHANMHVDTRTHEHAKCTYAQAYTRVSCRYFNTRPEHHFSCACTHSGKLLQASLHGLGQGVAHLLAGHSAHPHEAQRLGRRRLLQQRLVHLAVVGEICLGFEASQLAAAAIHVQADSIHLCTRPCVICMMAAYWKLEEPILAPLEGKRMPPDSESANILYRLLSMQGFPTHVVFSERNVSHDLVMKNVANNSAKNFSPERRRRQSASHAQPCRRDQGNPSGVGRMSDFSVPERFRPAYTQTANKANHFLSHEKQEQACRREGHIFFGRGAVRTASTLGIRKAVRSS